MKTNGYVRWYDNETGMGFATAVIEEQEVSVFIHFSELKENKWRPLREGDELTFAIHGKEDRLYAKEICVM